MRSRIDKFSIHFPHPLARELPAIGLLLALIGGFFWRLVTGDVYQPADGGDLVSFLFPTYRAVAAQLVQGRLPLWSPNLYAGAPLIGDIQIGAFYPPNFVLFILWPQFPYTTLQWFVIGHIFWAGLGLYLLLRTFCWHGRPVARPAALFGALAFALSDPILIHLGNLNLIAVLSWLPWILVLLLRALATGSLAWAAGAGLLFAIANYAGHAQSSLYLGLAVVGLTGCWTALTAPDAGRGLQTHLGRIVSQAGVVLLVALLLSLPILLPALELSQHSARRSLTYHEMTAFSLAPTQAIGLLTPGFFGRGPALHWSLWDRVETPYAGVATLLLAIAALILAGPRRRFLFMWVGIALFGFLTALGIYAIVHGWLTLVLPGFDRFRAPARALILWTFGISVLAGIGLDLAADRANLHTQRFHPLDTLLRHGGLILAGLVLPLFYLALLLTQENDVIFLRTSVAALALTLATGFWLATWLVLRGYRAAWWTRGWSMALLIAILYLDLSAAGAYTDMSPQDPTRGFEHPEIVAFLQSDPELFRIDTRTDIDDLWQPDTAALMGLHDVGGIANPLALQSWEQLWEATGGRQTPRYDMLNVKYVLVRDGTPLPAGKFVLAFDAPGELAVYRNETALPRAWLARSVKVVEDAAAALVATQDDDFTPRQLAILDAESFPASRSATEQEALTQIPTTPDTAQDTIPENGSILFEHYGSAEMTLHVSAPAPRYLLLSELWYPGWRATVNDAPVPVLRANGGLRAIKVPAGSAEVHLWFWPANLQWGLVGSALGGLLVVALVIWEARKRRTTSAMAQ